MVAPRTLLERDDGLAHLQAVIERAHAGHGGLTLIEGPAGVGKTALLDAATQQGTVLRARGGEYERDFAFGAIRQLLAGTPAPAAGPAAAAGRVLAPDGEPVEPGPGVLDAIFWLIAGMDQVVLAVDDLHWADQASLRALDYLGRRIADLPVAVIGTLRPAEPGAPAALLDAIRQQAEVIRPGVLGAASVATLVRERHPGADDDACAAFHRASGGNPLYLRELLQTVDTQDPEAIEAAAVPALGERVIRRIGRLAPDAPALAAAVAVLGDGQPLARAAEVAEIAPERSALLALELTRAGVFATDVPPAFVHPVLRRSVYSELSGARRASMHAYAAELLETSGGSIDEVARHLVLLPPAGNATVAQRLLAAGEDALARGDSETADRRITRAIDEGATTPSRGELLYAHGRALAAATDPRALAALQEALPLVGGEQRQEIAAMLVEFLAFAGQWDAALSLFDTVGPPQPGPAADGMQAIRAVATANDPQHVEEFRARRPEYERVATHQSWAAHAMAAVLAGDAINQGAPAETVMAYVERASADGVLLANRSGGWAAFHVPWALMDLDAHDEAGAFARRLLATGERTGSMLAVLAARGNQAWIAARRGDLDDAADRLEQVVELADKTGYAMGLTTLMHMFADLVAERPELRALTAPILAVELPPVFAATSSGAMLDESRARIALAEGDLERARESAVAVERIYRPLGIGPRRSTWRSLLALTIAPDDPGRAARLVEEEITLSRAQEAARPLGIALRAAGVLHEDEDALRESVAVLETVVAPLEAARSRYVLGGLLRRRGDLTRARDLLADAAEAAARSGALRLLAQATEELRLAGGRPRRVRRSGTNALTPRERRVAGLAAEGRSNPEIAQELYLSLKTVETHLSAAYRKLGVSGRGAREALAGALRA